MLNSLSKIRSALIGTYLRKFSHKPFEMNPDWVVSDELLKNITIRWPRHYEWTSAADWVDIIRIQLEGMVNVQIVDDIPQNYKGTVVIEYTLGNIRKKVAICYSDYPDIDDDCVRLSDLVFKMQYQELGYGSSKVIPGGYVTDGKSIYQRLEKLRALREKRSYIYDVYGRFGLGYARNVRQKAIDILNAQKEFGFEGGMKTVSYNEFLAEVANSKICIDLPGLGSFCFRLVNYLALGSFIIAYPHTNILNHPLVDREHIVYCKEDFSDLVALCEYYLKNDDERERIAGNAKEYFDKYLHKDNLANYYLNHMVE